jgi:ribosomal-protein-alanine N-acetyltransferase
MTLPVIPPSCTINIRRSGVGSSEEWTPVTLSFSSWTTVPNAWELARTLWGEERVTHSIGGGPFTLKRVAARFADDISWQEDYGVEYWPVFVNGDFAGCCGLKPNTTQNRPKPEDGLQGLPPGVDPELLITLQKAPFIFGFYYLPKYWRTGVAKQAALHVLRYLFFDRTSPLHRPQPLKASKPEDQSIPPPILRLGHHPTNVPSERLSLSLGFVPVKSVYFAPTGLYHPNYVLTPALLSKVDKERKSNIIRSKH